MIATTVTPLVAASTATASEPIAMPTEKTRLATPA